MEGLGPFGEAGDDLEAADGDLDRVDHGHREREAHDHRAARWVRQAAMAVAHTSTSTNAAT